MLSLCTDFYSYYNQYHDTTRVINDNILTQLSRITNHVLANLNRLAFCNIDCMSKEEDLCNQSAN